MAASSSEKSIMDREALRSVVQQWNANRLDLFELSEPDENLQFHGVMRFYFQDLGQKVATKCIRVASDATVSDVIETLVEKFRPDMRMLTLPNYALYEVHSNHEERKLNSDEKPLLVQLNWHMDDREGRFLLKNIDQRTNTLDSNDTIFKRKLSKRDKKEQKKKEKLIKLQPSNGSDVAEKLYTELPETSFTRSISNPEAVMRRRRQQQLEKKLQQFRSRDGGPDTGGTLKIYGESLCRDVPYKTLLLSIRDCAQAVVREMLSKYGMEKADPLHYCLVQVNSDATEYILDDDECPLSILMNHPTSRGSIMFHVRRRPADSQPRRRKKKPLGSNGNNVGNDREGPMLVEITHSGDGGRRMRLGSEPIEVGSANTNTLNLFGPSIQPIHCLISLNDGICTVTPLHADAITFVNGHHIQQSTILHNGSVVMFGRVASYRFVDSPSDGRYNLALSQSQLDSACLYESRSPASPSWHEEDRPLSPVHSIAQAQNPKHSVLETNDLMNNRKAVEQQQQPKHQNFDFHHHHHHPPQENLDDAVDGKVSTNLDDKRRDNLEVPYDIDGNTETKSISSIKSTGSNQDNRSNRIPSNIEPGLEPILPAVLEFPETHQETFLRQVITELDVTSPNFKLAPVYTLYLCARYRASTHYRPDLQPTERAHKLTVFLHHVANLIHNIVQDQYTDPKILSFWMANSAEFLHFLKSDRHISAFSVQAQEVLAESVQTAFRNLVACFHTELSQTLSQFMSENIEHEAAATLVLQVLGSAMALLRRCRVNAALTIQLFSQLFHYINVVCFNKIVTTTYMCTAEWGKLLSERLRLLELWAERQGLELAADCHLAKINQCAQFLEAPKTTVADVQQLACSCFKLNSLQMTALLSQENIPRNITEAAVRMAESVADELIRADGREIRLEESPDLPLSLLLPDDGFSCDVVRGIPAGLVDFVSPFQVSGMCRLAAQPSSIGIWTVYMHHYNSGSSNTMSSKIPQPEIQIIKLHKHTNGMGLSIVAAKGAGQEKLGIYIKSVVAGGAADLDSRLQAGDQLLRVDGQSLIGITQERAADYLVRTGPVVTLEVAKQGAIYHGLATLLQQPSPINQRGNRRMSDREFPRIESSDAKPPTPLPNPQLLNSKSVPALHHVGNNIAMSGNKSRSIHNLAGNNDQGFYQNLNVYRSQNQSQPNLERSQMTLQSNVTSPHVPTTSSIQQQQQPQNRPVSAYFTNNTSNTMPSQASMSSMMPSGSSSSSNNIKMNNPNISQNQQSNNSIHQQQNQTITPSGSMRSKNNFPGQSNIHMSPMMAPSMPNIAYSSGYATNISSSQSMQNVNMIPNTMSYANQHGPTTNQMLQQPSTSHQHGYPIHQAELQQHQRQQAALLRGQAKLAEMGEELKRRHQRAQQQQDAMINAGSQILTSKSGGRNSPSLLAANQSQQNNLKHQVPASHQNQSQYNMYPNNPPANYNVPSANISGTMIEMETKPLPPTAPKPQLPLPDDNHLHQQMQQQQQPPLPPTQTHPLFTGNPPQNQNYVASTAEPQKTSYYPTANINPQNKMFGTMVKNPWEREEREKEQEIRREQLRQWREKQISDLLSIQHRTPQQEEQLKTLALERDFERRALEPDDQDEEMDLEFQKDGTHEIRLQPQVTQIPTPITNMKQIETRTNIIGANEQQQQQQQQHGDININQMMNQQPPPIQPKSILKHNGMKLDNTVNNNTLSPSKQSKSASFADERTLSENSSQPQIMNKIMKDMGNMNLNNEMLNTQDDNNMRMLHPNNNNNNMEQKHSPTGVGYNTNINTMSSTNIPPPPPERNSSYIIMSQQQQKFRTSTLPNMKSTVSHSDQLTNFVIGNKRLSNNNTINNNKLNNNQLINEQQQQIIPPPQQQQQHQQQQQIHFTNQSAFVRDNKRVSFHDEENNHIQTPVQYQQANIIDKIDNEIMREDPNRFITETQALLLDSPMTPEGGEMWNAPLQQTPGVIGAQEVYRDPRQRRLQEKQQQQMQQKSGEVPEKLSFKEKMKMFALESGENQTPKDKLKISRAQRDIDAVH